MTQEPIEPPHARAPYQSERPVEDQSHDPAETELAPAPIARPDTEPDSEAPQPGDRAGSGPHGSDTGPDAEAQRLGVPRGDVRASGELPGSDPLTGERPDVHPPNEAEGFQPDEEGADTVVNHGENPQVLYEERNRPTLESGPAHQLDEEVEGGRSGGTN